MVKPKPSTGGRQACTDGHDGDSKTALGLATGNMRLHSEM